MPRKVIYVTKSTTNNKYLYVERNICFMNTYKIFNTSAVLGTLLFSLLSLGSCKKEIVEPVIENPLIEIPLEELTNAEMDDLLFLREEEKLAHDVYLYAYEQYNVMIFQNISNSEQTHMDSVLVTLNKYGIADPASEVRGEFSNQTLQDLYLQLTLKVDSSLVDALIVGATIEDLDLFDLQINIENTSKTDLIDMYNLLYCGSRNHMRAFYKNLVKEGATYTNQYISDSEFQSIINSDKEYCG